MPMSMPMRVDVSGDDTAPSCLAVDLGGTTTRVALVRGASVIERREAPTPAGAGPDAVVAELAGLLGTWRSLCDRVCLAATGRVHAGRVSAVNRATMPGWEAYPLAAELSARIGLAVHVMNDAHAAAWGEYVYGAGRGCRDFAFVTVSTGIGAGLVVAGRLARGARGMAGHIGFLPGTGPDGAILEAEASGSGIARAASQALGDPLTTRAVFAAAAAGDALAQSVIDAAVERLAQALVQLRWLVDPERIAIGGSVGLAHGYLPRLVAAVARLDPSARLLLVPAALGRDAGLLGAAAALAADDASGAAAPDTHAPTGHAPGSV